jgi:hypothetical protein
MNNDVTAPVSSERTGLARAKRQVAAIKGFYIHLAIYAAIVLGLLALNLAFSRDWWVQWVVLGWGIGVVAHALAVFGRKPQTVADWEKRKLDQIMTQAAADASRPQS